MAGFSLKQTWDDSLLVTDTREQLALFETSMRVTLKTGDMSVLGLESQVAVERKSVADLLGSLGGKCGARRKRFEAEFARLGKMERGAVVIEGTMRQIRQAPRFGRITANHAIGAMTSWGARHRVQVTYCNDRQEARAWVKLYLRLAWEGLSNDKR